MRYRVEAEGGSMRLESTPGKGTLIEAILPVTDIDSPEATTPAAGGDAGVSAARPLPRAAVGRVLRPRGCSPDRAARAYPIAFAAGCHGH